MTPAQILGLMLGDGAEPVLAPDTITQLLAQNQVRDEAGRWTTDAGYIPTYDLNRAAAQGWRMKAAKVANGYTVKIEGRELNRAELVQNFLTMAKEYAKLAPMRSSGLQDPLDRTLLWSRSQ